MVLIKANLKKAIPSRLKSIMRRMVFIFLVWKREDPPQWPLPAKYQKQDLERYEYSLSSQNGEDGILRHLFDEIGFRSKRFLEFGFGATENNSLRLVMKEGFGGVFIDGSDVAVASFNEAARAVGVTNVNAIKAFLTLENLETIIQRSGLPEEIDLLSIDVDGNDYWFWENITCISPRVVVIEFNASLGPNLSLTIPYDPNFSRHAKHASGFYAGASLTALERLGKKKGYGLVGCDSKGVNAFFVRNDCLTPNTTVVSAQLAYRPHRSRLERGLSLEEQHRIIKDMPYVEIE